MKNRITLLAIFGLLVTSCGSGDYPIIQYTNNYTEAITIDFKTAEKESPLYSLAVGESILLSSDIHGRTEIKSISERLATWEYRNGNVYDIRFIKRTAYNLKIRNFIESKITVMEKNGLLERLSVEAEAASGENAGEAAYLIYTDQPVFLFIGVQDINFKLRRDNGNFILGINPPAGEWWKD